MNQGFVNKVIKVIFKILGNFKIIKKRKVMPKDNQHPTPPVIPTIGGNTQIVFTVKSFLATLGSILALFISFYFLVFQPRAEKVEVYQKQLYDQQQVYITGEFGKVNEAIKANSNTITDLTKRFEDLSTTIENSGGGFGGNSTTSHTGDPAVDPELAVNHQ